MPTRADPFGAWFGLGLDMMMLGAEASSVIALRSLKLASGGAGASEEASLMVSEKIEAGMIVAQRAMFGQLGSTMPGIASKAVADYRKRVRANGRRLRKR